MPPLPSTTFCQALPTRVGTASSTTDGPDPVMPKLSSRWGLARPLASGMRTRPVGGQGGQAEEPSRQRLAVKAPDGGPLQRRERQIGGSDGQTSKGTAQSPRPNQIQAHCRDGQAQDLEDQQQPRVGPDPVQGS